MTAAGSADRDGARSALESAEAPAVSNATGADHAETSARTFRLVLYDALASEAMGTLTTGVFLVDFAVEPSTRRRAPHRDIHLGDLTRAQAYFRQAAEIDLANNMGNAAGGVHMGALGGLWQAAVFGAAGLQVREDGIAVDPHPLPGWAELAFPVQWRGRLLRLRFAADPRRIEVAVEKGDELTVAVIEGPVCRARGGQRFTLYGDRSGWGNWKEVGR